MFLISERSNTVINKIVEIRFIHDSVEKRIHVHSKHNNVQLKCSRF